ncbi:MAG: InlB B-repeat-containing protein, partial [Chthoniobacteraceae bacterium]
IYISSALIGPRSARSAQLLAVHPDGTQKWANELSIPSENFWGLSYPVIGNDGTTYVAAGPLLYAISPAGAVLWTKSFGSQSDLNARISAPAIGADGTLYISRADGVLFAITSDQQTRWQYPGLGTLSFPPSIAADGTIYIAPSSGALRAINPDGTLKWTSTQGNARTPIAISASGEIIFGIGGLYDGKVARLNSNGTLKRIDSAFPVSSGIVLGATGAPFFSATDGSIVSLSASGAVLWKHQPHPAMPATTPILGDDGRVYFASSAGDTHRFIAYNPDGSIMWENGALAQNAGDSNVWTSLALDRNGVLYGGSRSGKFYAVQATGRLATGDWPKPGADYRNTNRQPSPGPATAPVITLVPQSTDVVAGQTLTLTARASGTPEPSYQWFASGQAIAGATSPTLAVRNVQVSHAGEYFVRISNSVGSTESVPVNVKVLLTLEAEATAGGSVTVESAQTTYDVGSSATITATAADGYEFTGWTGDAEGTQNPLIVTLNANKTVTANFVRTYVLTLNPVGSGSIAVTPQQARYRSGQSVTVTAVPDDGYGFSGWTGALAGEAPMGTVLMDADKSVTATFVPLRTLNAQAQTGGSVTVAPNRTTFLNGAQVTLTAAREPGYDFKGWTGDIESQANPLVVTLDRNVSLLATFGPAQPPAVSFDVPANSSVSDRRFSLTGAISDNNAIASATWEREGESMGDLTLVDGKFAVPALTLVEGVNRFRIITADSVGNETVADYVITWTPSQVLEVAVPAEETEGRLITVPIRLTSTGDVSGTAFTLSFDSAYFRTEDFYFVPEFASPFNQVNRSTPGRVRASLAYVTTLPAGTIDIGYAVLRVRSVPQDMDAVLELSEASTASFLGDSLNDSTAIHSGAVRLLKRAHVGDINANGRLDVGDASLIQRLVTEIELPRAWDIPANDLNGNTALDVGDVQRALSTAAGIFPQPGSAQPGTTVSPRRGATAAASTPESIRLVAERHTASAGEQWVVRVVVDHLSGPLAGASFTLDYPTAALRLVDSSSHEVGSLLPTNSFATVWNVAPARNDYAAQTGRVSMAASSAATNSATEGVLAEFTFQVQPGAAGQSSWPLTLRNSDLTSDGFLVRSLPAAELVFNGWAVRYADWQHAAFQGAPGGNGGDSAPDADPDRDGITNRMEYQFGSDPLGADAGGAVQSSIEVEDGEHFLTLTYTRRRDAADTTARVEVSTDLETWLYNEDGTGKTYTVETSASDNGDGTEEVVVRVLNGTELGARTFVRVNFVEN